MHFIFVYWNAWSCVGKAVYICIGLLVPCCKYHKFCIAVISDKFLVRSGAWFVVLGLDKQNHLEHWCYKGHLPLGI